MKDREYKMKLLKYTYTGSELKAAGVKLSLSHNYFKLT